MPTHANEIANEARSWNRSDRTHRAVPQHLRRNKVGLLIAIFALALPFEMSALAQDQPSPISAEALEAIKTQMRSLIAAEMEQKQIPAFSIALVDGERVVWSEGFGLAHQELQIPATGQTIYRVGSISKLLTDMAVMQQVAAGTLDLDADVREYLPSFRPRDPFGKADSITLRNLMAHRTGLVRESPVGNYFDDTEPTLTQTVESLNETDLVYASGERTKYSNAGIAVVGHVLAQRLNKDFETILQEQLIGPLGMNDSFWRVTEPRPRELAQGWMWTHEGRRFEAPEFALGTLPAGNLYSSVEDLSRFMIAVCNQGKLEGKSILDPELVATMLTPVDASESVGYGVGFRLSDFEGCPAFSHGGAVYGFSTQVRGLPDQRLAVAAVANLDGANGVVLRLSDHALKLLLAAQRGTSASQYELTEAIPKERARQIAGVFQGDQTNHWIELEERDGRLMLREGSLLSELRQQADRWIVDDVVSYGPSLEIRSLNEVVWRGTTYRRAEEKLPPACPHHWRGLIGEYGWDHNTLYILEDQGTLIALIEWFYFYPLTQVTEDRYAFPNYGLYPGEELVFERDDSAKATRVVAASVAFERRQLTEEGATFQIVPLKPIDELRELALASQPPVENKELRASDLVELIEIEPSFHLDIRYATQNNFMGSAFYTQPRAFLQREAAEALRRVQRRAAAYGLGLLIHDAYRPWYVTKMFYEGTPDELKIFVANPARGSRHNRGCAVDLTLYHLATGEPVSMVAGYDEFTSRAYPHYPGGTSQERWYRSLLRRMMEAEGFEIYEFEWWHFDHKNWEQYPLGNARFEDLGN